MDKSNLGREGSTLAYNCQVHSMEVSAGADTEVMEE